MKPTKTLILGLRSAALRLRQKPEEYNWYNSDRCNCGILAQELLGLDESALFALRRKSQFMGSWKASSRLPTAYCSATGLPLSAVFTALAEHGLEQNDYEALEFFGLGIRRDYQNPSIVADYFDKCAVELEERRKAGERP